MKRNISLSLCATVLCLLLLLCGSMFAQDNAARSGVLTKSEFNRAVYMDVSPPLRDLIASQPVSVFGYHEASPALKPKLLKQIGYGDRSVAKTVGQEANVALAAPVAAAINWSVLGVGIGFHGYTVPDAPTDSNGASGDWPGNQGNAQVVEWVNVSYAVFNKATGAYIAGPISGQTLWSGFAGNCSASNSGDIVVQFDKMAHRWVLFQPRFTAPYASCFAISTSPDATGSYIRYQFPQNAGFPDYPKIGIQPEAYYQAQNMFNNQLTAYIGAQPCAYNRVKMLAGDPTAEQVCTLDTSNGTLFDDSMLPADLDTPNLPMPAGTPEVYVGSIDNYSSETHIYEYTYSVNFPAGTAVLTGVNGANPITLGTLPAFVGLCNFGSSGCIPQLGVTTSSSGLDSLGDRLMFRLALHRGINAANVPVTSYLVGHSIVNGSTGAVRWYELRAPANNPTALSFYQGNTFAPDSIYRFMGSLAMDKNGNILLGYSRSSSTQHPDVYFTGRAASDPLGTMQGETALVNQSVATGSQRSTSHRWGDYSSMTIDLDGCSMIYVNQYYTTTTTFAWSTNVSSLKFNTCTPTVLP